MVNQVAQALACKVVNGEPLTDAEQLVLHTGLELIGASPLLEGPSAAAWKAACEATREVSDDPTAEVLAEADALLGELRRGFLSPAPTI